jgi:serine protease
LPRVLHAVLKSRMFRCFHLLWPALLLAFSFQAGAQPVRGLIVKLKPDAEASGARESAQAVRDRLASAARGAGLGLYQQRSVGNAHQLVRLARPLEGAALERIISSLRQNPDVASVEPDVLMKRLAMPNDTYYASSQWNLQAPSAYAAAINMPPAWDRSTGSAGITVAVLDTGILKAHPDLQGRYWPGYDFVSEVEYANDGDGRDPDPSDPGDWVSSADKTASPALFGSCKVEASSWHGSFIAGQIAAVTNNAMGIAGITWNGMVLPVRVSGKCGAFLSDILDAMRWAAGLSVSGVPNNPNPARIINLSFGGDIACTASYQDVINEVTAAGALVVVAAGNDGGQAKRPADCQNVLAVGAVRSDGLKTSYSDIGTTLRLMAPGGSVSSGTCTGACIYSVSNTGTTSPLTSTYRSEQGTSFSAPQAAGVAALMLALNPALTPPQLITRMQAGARPHIFNASYPSCSNGSSNNGVCNCTADTCGAGLLDASNATFQAANPAAVIAGVGTPVAGSTLTLDGRASAATTGAVLIGYQWSQVSGAAVSIQNPFTALASVALPAQAGTFVFKLVVTDSTGRSGQDVLTVTSTAASSGGGGGGGGATGWLWGAGLWGWALLLGWRRLRRVC